MGIRLYFLIFVFIFFASCKKENLGDCFKSTGDIISETRYFSPYHQIEIENNIDVIITEGPSYKAKISAGENLIGLIKTDLEGGKLIIKNNNTCNWVRSYKHKITAEIEAPLFTEITYRGSGTIKTATILHGQKAELHVRGGSGTVDLNIEFNEFWCIQHTGPADIYLKGEVGVMYTLLNGYGYIYSSDVLSHYHYVRNSGTADAYIRVEKELGAQIHYIGNIYYYGNPYKIDTEILHSGKLIKLE